MTYDELTKASDEIFMMINKCYDLHEKCGSTLLLEIADDLKKQLKVLYNQMQQHRLLDRAIKENLKWKKLTKNKSS
jgi:hypothetical protein